MTARFLADTSALSRMTVPAVAQRLGPPLAEGLIATCAIVDLEVLYSARGPADYETIREERRALEDAPITPSVMQRALEVQRILATRGRHRLPIPDLIVAAAAESAGLAILHYDADYERIAEVTGQAHRWVAPRGTL
ncbi:MAG: PIN domain nuclease [Actinobacteria bacterium]|nr:PIN domain nuclease [Actinomycetota bacterium]